MKKEIKIHALDLDIETKKQFDLCCEEDFVLKAALMPDAHHGYVAPIGSVFHVKDHLIPSWVGYDIGCGMIACKFDGEFLVEKVQEKKEELFVEVKKRVPMGTGAVNHEQDISKQTKTEFKKLLENFKQGPHKVEVLDFLRKKALSHLGSLGSGNHFIELGEANGELWLVIHSGSRGVGHKVATHYMQESSGKKKDFEATHPLEANSELGKEYLNILNFGLDFALLNRLEMAYTIRDILRELFKISDLDFELWVNKNHNHAIFEQGVFVHRKGATPAKKGERGVIPANMRDGSFLVEGLGSSEFLESSSHGAGRRLSRNQARKEISMEAFESSMREVKGTISQGTLDEAPMAYKNISDVMNSQKESVKVLKHIKVLINWKGES